MIKIDDMICELQYEHEDLQKLGITRLIYRETDNLIVINCLAWSVESDIRLYYEKKMNIANLDIKFNRIELCYSELL